MIYIYTFSVWPSETWGFNKSFFNLFRALNTRLELEFTEEEFNTYRSGLNHHGLTLREIERLPQRQAEKIY